MQLNVNEAFGGLLAAEALQLRFVTLPAETSDTEGSILMIRNGEVTKKAYTPGRQIGDEVSRTLTGPGLEALVAALLEADVVTLVALSEAAEEISPLSRFTRSVEMTEVGK